MIKMRYIGKSVLYRPPVKETQTIDTLETEIKRLEGIIRKKEQEVKDLLECYGEISKWFYGDDEVILVRETGNNYEVIGYAPEKCIKEVEKYNKKYRRGVL
jgi:hypothetical protein